MRFYLILDMTSLKRSSSRETSTALGGLWVGITSVPEDLSVLSSIIFQAYYKIEEISF